MFEKNVIFALILGAPIQYFCQNTWVQSYRKKGDLCFKKQNSAKCFCVLNSLK